MAAMALGVLPGYRRRFRVTPAAGWVKAELEDDMHCMAVLLRHRDGVVTAVEAEQDRAPWNTCGGAMDQLVQTFAGQRLEGFADRGEKTLNCTHLYDLAQLAAAHAQDQAPIIYDILVSDPVEGRRRMELRRDGAPLMRWVEEDGRLVEPAEIAGLTLLTLSPWISSLDPARQEPARLLRWGGLVAHGRTLPFEEQSDATRMPPNCYTFQPEQAVHARRIGKSRDFSTGHEEPLGHKPAPSLDPATPTHR
jgi:hypothetical protein